MNKLAYFRREPSLKQSSDPQKTGRKPNLNHLIQIRPYKKRSDLPLRLQETSRMQICVAKSDENSLTGQQNQGDNSALTNSVNRLTSTQKKLQRRLSLPYRRDRERAQPADQLVSI